MAPKPNIPPPSSTYLRQKQMGYQQLQEDRTPSQAAPVPRARGRGRVRVAAVEEIALGTPETVQINSRSNRRSSAENLVLKGVAACGQRMLIAAMRISLVGLLFLVSIYLSFEIVTVPKLGVYSAISSKQIAMKYEAPHCGYNVSGTDVGMYNATSTGGYGGIGQYLVLTNSRGETDMRDTLKNFKADIYRIEVIGTSGGLDGQGMSPSAGGRRGRSVYYEMESSIMFLMPPFLLRAFTLGVLWPSLGRLLVNVQEDNCSLALVRSDLEHMAAAAVTSQLMDAMNREGGTIGYRHQVNESTWHGDAVDWTVFECLTYDERPDDVPSVRVSRLEYVTCAERSPHWNKPTIGFFVLDVVLSLMFVLFIFTAFRMPFITIADELADHEVKEFQDDITGGNFPAGSAQADMAKKLFQQFDDGKGKEELHKDDVNMLLGRPLMLIDFIVSDPVNCMFVGPTPLDYHYDDGHKWVRSKWAPFGDALVSAFIHWLLIVVVGMPLVFMALMLGCEPEDEYEYASAACDNRPFSMYILYCLWAKDAFGFLYCATHYLQLDGPRQSPPPAPTAIGALCDGLAALLYLVVACITVPVRKIALLLWSLTAMCSLAYGFNVFAWMVLTILLKPSLAITAITLLAVPCAYAFFSFIALNKMKEAVLGSSEAKDAHATLKRYGLRTQDILLTVAIGLLLIITLVCWCVLGFALFTNSLDNPASIVPALGLLGGSATGARRDVTGFQKKVDAESGTLTGNLHAAEQTSNRGSLDEAELGQAGVEAEEPQAPQPSPQAPQPSPPTCDAGAEAEAGA